MNNVEILSLVVTIICLVSFCLVFTFLFRHYYLSNINEIKEGKADKEVIEYNKERIEKNKKKSEKTKRIASRIASYAFLGLVVAFFGFSLYSRFFNNNLLFGDSGFIVISSGSMSERNSANDYLDEYNLNNQFDTYDIIGVTKYQSVEEINQYDVVAFYGEDDVIYVHRIIEIRDDNTFVTRGDSNAISDTNRLYNGYLTYDKIIGKYNDARVPLLGVFIVFLQSNSGIITVLSVVYCLLMFDHYRNKYEESIESRIEYLDSVLKYDYSSSLPVEEEIKIDYNEVINYKDNPEIVLKMNINEEGETSLNKEKAKSEGNEKPSKIKKISAKVKEKWNNLVSKLNKDKRDNKE